MNAIVSYVGLEKMEDGWKPDNEIPVSTTMLKQQDNLTNVGEISRMKINLKIKNKNTPRTPFSIFDIFYFYCSAEIQFCLYLYNNNLNIIAR